MTLATPNGARQPENLRAPPLFLGPVVIFTPDKATLSVYEGKN